MSILKTYRLRDVILIVGGIDFHAFGEDAAITFEWSEDLGELSLSADGREGVFSEFSGEILFCDVNFLETSKAYREMAGLQQSQRGQSPILPYNFKMADPNNGDSVSAPYSVFIQRPGPSKAKVRSSRAYRLGMINPTVLYGPLNAI